MTNRAITISAKSRDKKPFPIEVKVRMEAAAEMGQNRCLEGRTEPSKCHQSGSENTATPSMAKIGVVIGCHHLFAVTQYAAVIILFLQYQEKLAGLNILNIMKIFCQSESRTRDKAKGENHWI